MTTPKEPVSFSEEIKQNELKAISRNIDQSFDQLVNNNEVRSRLPEKLFVDNFLGFFAGQVPRERSAEHYIRWIAIAGTPMSEVDIIDNRGQKIFSVPAIFDSSFINVTDRKAGESLSDIYHETGLHAATSPARGDAFLAEKLTPLADSLSTAATSANPNQGRWSEIFDRYGIKNPEARADSPETGDTSADDEDDLEY